MRFQSQLTGDEVNGLYLLHFLIVQRGDGDDGMTDSRRLQEASPDKVS